MKKLIYFALAFAFVIPLVIFLVKRCTSDIVKRRQERE